MCFSFPWQGYQRAHRVTFQLLPRESLDFLKWRFGERALMACEWHVYIINKESRASVSLLCISEHVAVVTFVSNEAAFRVSTKLVQPTKSLKGFVVVCLAQAFHQ